MDTIIPTHHSKRADTGDKETSLVLSLLNNTMKGFADTFTYSFFACEIFAKVHHKSVNVKSLLIFRTAININSHRNDEVEKQI